jgi:two-component system cell cycle sensor histidine kinase/response regulator CckA
MQNPPEVFDDTARLEVRMRRLEEQLRQAQKMEAVGQLAGGIAHDFNNLLTVITGCAQVLLEEMRPEDLLRVEAEEIMKAGERAATLTNRLLAFSRRQVAEPEIIDLNRLVADMDKMLRRVIGADIELVTSFGKGLGKIKADPGQVEHIIMNLVVNARDAMPAGGRLTIETANALRDEPAGAGACVTLTVTDTGVGMDEEIKGHLFEPFFTTKEPGKGTGLGLSTVWTIVQQNGGNIQVRSEPGWGTRFQIYLPRVNEEAEVAVSGARSAGAQAGSETVLLVEDEERVRRLVLGMLRRQGYTVLEAADGRDALHIAKQCLGPIHVLLTDVAMPKMDGHALALRLAGLLPDLRVVYMSGYMDNPAVHETVAKSGAAFLQKPFSQEALGRKIRGVLDTSAKRAGMM